jgi:hypothetical protein
MQAITTIGLDIAKSVFQAQRSGLVPVLGFAFGRKHWWHRQCPTSFRMIQIWPKTHRRPRGERLGLAPAHRDDPRARHPRANQWQQITRQLSCHDLDGSV